MMKVGLVLCVAVAVLPGPASAQDHEGHSAHAGKETREISALSAEEVRALLEGEGAGYALAAELNHYPGPRHALDLRDALSLTPDQVDAIRAIFDRMNARARELGARLVDRERELDAAFRDRSITSDRLARLVKSIADVDAELRTAHLDAHLRTTALLSEDQIRRYDQARGYATHER